MAMFLQKGQKSLKRLMVNLVNIVLIERVLKCCFWQWNIFNFLDEIDELNDAVASKSQNFSSSSSGNFGVDSQKFVMKINKYDLLFQMTGMITLKQTLIFCPPNMLVSLVSTFGFLSNLFWSMKFKDWFMFCRKLWSF
jgi:hypothetical protein